MIDQTPGYISGVNRVRIVNQTNTLLTELYFLNPSNHYSKTGDSDSPTSTIDIIRASHLGSVAGNDSSVLNIKVNPPLGPGETVLVDIAFKTNFSRWRHSAVPTQGKDGDVVVYNGIYFFPILQYYFPDGWHPDKYREHKNQVTNLATFTATMTIPEEYLMGSSATVINKKNLATGHDQYELTDQYSPGFSIVVSKHLRSTLASVSGVSLEVLYPPHEQPQIPKVFHRLEQLIPYYKEHFGAQPFDKLLISVGYSINARAISLPNHIIFQDQLDYSQLLDHELAHQWFGHSLLSGYENELWLCESLAEYVSWSFNAAQNEKSNAFTFTAPLPDVNILDDIKAMDSGDWVELFREIVGDNSLPPMYEPGKQLRWEEAESVYSKYIAGNYALQTLQASIGDADISRILTNYRLLHSGSIANLEDLIREVENNTSTAIANNFRLAITTSLRPDLKINKIESVYTKNHTWENHIHTSSISKWSVPVDMLTVTESGDTTFLERVSWNDETTITLITKSPIILAELDPHKRMFDANRFNNRWPRQIGFQLRYGLPTWETYRLRYYPRLRKDWQGHWRTGVKISGGIGINLMPIMPVFYQNLFDLELTFSYGLPSKNWGLVLNYKTPLKSTNNLYWSFAVGYEYPKNWGQIALVNYFGDTAYLSVHGKSYYSRLTSTLSMTEYLAANPNDWWNEGKSLKLKEEWRLFYYSAMQRYFIEIHALGGFKEDAQFFSFGFASDYESHAYSNFILRGHAEGGVVWDQRAGNELVYRLLFVPKIWQHRQGRIPHFRGVANIEQDWVNNILSGGFSLGYETSYFVRSMVYIDIAKISNASGSFGQRIDQLINDKDLYIAAGIGLEMQTMMEIGLYFPFWISHPVSYSQHFAPRVLMQWGFYF